MNKNTKRKKLASRVKTGETSVVSMNTDRNMQMKIYWNKSENGNFSVTRHEPINDKLGSNPKRHKFYKKDRDEILKEIEQEN
jgi:hypothetical protein